MVGAQFIQILIKKLSNTLGKFNFIMDTQIGKLKTISNDNDLNRALKTCSEAKKIVSTLDSPVSSVNNILKNLKNLVNTLKNLIKVLKNSLKLINANPLKPLTPAFPPIVAPPPSGIVPPGIPLLYPSLGKINSLNQVSTNILNNISKLESYLDNITQLINTINNTISTTSSKLNDIKPLFNECIKKQIDLQLYSNKEPENISYSSISLDIDKIINQLKSEISSDLLESNNYYKGYTFEIREINEEFTSNKVKRRYAVAINSNGIISFQGTPSFATNKQILIDELKFHIDNDILNNN